MEQENILNVLDEIDSRLLELDEKINNLHVGIDIIINKLVPKDETFEEEDNKKIKIKKRDEEQL